jgi:hypothetical protein
MIIENVVSYNKNPIMYNNINNIHMKSESMISYLTSIKDYTILSNRDDNKIKDLLDDKKLQYYYVNIENLLDKKDIYDFLTKKYKNVNNIDNMWVFYKGFYMGNGDELLELIKNKKNNHELLELELDKNKEKDNKLSELVKKINYKENL